MTSLDAKYTRVEIPKTRTCVVCEENVEICFLFRHAGIVCSDCLAVLDAQFNKKRDVRIEAKRQKDKLESDAWHADFEKRHGRPYQSGCSNCSYDYDGPARSGCDSCSYD